MYQSVHLTFMLNSIYLLFFTLISGDNFLIYNFSKLRSR